MPLVSSGSMILKRSLLSLAFVGIVATIDCDLQPLALPLKNVTFADGIGLNRGIPVQLGGQPEGLRLTFSANNTRVRNSADCDLLSPNQTAVIVCRGSSGSIFNINASSTWQSSLESTWNVSAIDPRPAGATVVQGYDTAIFNDNVTIKGFPFEVWSDADAANKSAIGLGPFSSFLREIGNWSYAPDWYAFGLFFGSRSQDFGRDGELVIGGYDQGKIVPGNNFTEWDIKNWTNTELPIVCPLQVHLQNIILNNSQGSFPLSADPDARIPACLDPLQNEFTFTKAMYNIWANVTNHTYISTDGSKNFSDQTYPASMEPLMGNLTVILSNGYTTVIPHYELISFERGDDSEGKYAVTNTSRVMSAVGTGLSAYGYDIPILGGVFLSQNYLMVDYARGKFGLAPSVTLEQGSENITAICYSSSTSKSGHKINVGAVVGGVVGGVGGAIVVVILASLFFCCYKKERNPRPKKPSIAREGGVEMPLSEGGRSWGGDPELDKPALRTSQTPATPFRTMQADSADGTRRPR